jgi:nucleoside-diphosphate-sugar epimerase
MNNIAIGQPRVLITGSTGFIGSSLVAALSKEGWNVHVLVREQSKLPSLAATCTVHRFDGKMSSMNQIMSSSKPEAVIHIASQFLSEHTADDIDRLIESNILFGTQLLDSMARNGVRRILNTGTSWQHFQDKEFDPVNLYAATKQAFESIAEYYVQAHEFSVSTLYMFDTYGPGDTRKKLIPLLLDALMSGTELQMSPGEQLIDLLFVDDVTQAFSIEAKALMLRGQSNLRFGLSSESRVTLKQLVGIFEQVAGKKLSINWGGRLYRNREVMTPWTKYNHLPNWAPKVNLISGIRRVIAHHRSQVSGRCIEAQHDTR